MAQQIMENRHDLLDLLTPEVLHNEFLNKVAL
jgi:hypothetical protein